MGVHSTYNIHNMSFKSHPSRKRCCICLSVKFFYSWYNTMKTCFKTFVSQYSYNETNFFVKRNGQRLLRWKHREPMLFYWFSLGAEKGEITWSANCNPEGEFKSHCILTVILKVRPKDIVFQFWSWRWVQET